MNIFKLQLNNQPLFLQPDKQKQCQNQLRFRNVLYQDTVSFGHNTSENISSVRVCPTQITVNALKGISDLPCIYCGEPMLSVSDKSKIVKAGAEATGKELAEVLENNRKYLRRFKNGVADAIIEKAYMYPNEDVQKILTRLVPEYITQLEQDQMKVLRNLQDKYSKAFKSAEEQKVFSLLLYETSQWIHNESGDRPFKCKSFYGELERILNLPIFRDRKIVKQIMFDARKMPQSTESESAFVVKYSKRSPREIMDLLFFEPTVTVEHIKPQMMGGTSEAMANLAMACSNCNGARRGHLPLDVFVAENPEIENNIKKQFRKLEIEGNRQDKRLAHVENNQAVEMSRYISEIAKTFMRESKNSLHLEEYVI